MICGVRSTVIGIFVVAFLAGFTVNSVQAQTLFNWTNGNGNLAWTNSANWDVGVGYPGSASTTDTATFALNTSSNTVSIGLGSTSQTVGEIVFSNPGSGFVISGGTVNLSDGGAIVMTNIGNNNNVKFSNTITAAVNLLGSGTVTNNNSSQQANPTPGGTLYITGNLSGTGALTVTSTNTSALGGLVQISGSNNSGFTGTINVVTPNPFLGGLYSNNRSNFGNASALNFTNGIWQLPQAVAMPITINAGGTLFGANTYTQPVSVTVNSGGTLQVKGGVPNYSGAISGQGSFIYSGGNANLTATDLTFSGTSANTLSGPITVQTGKLNLNKTPGVNAIASPITIGSPGLGGAALVWSASNQINGGSVVTLLSLGSGTTNAGQIWMRGNSDTIAGLQDTGGSGTAIVQNQLASTNGTLSVNPGAGNSYNFGGIIHDGSPSGQGTMSFRVTGAGQQILSGVNNTYTGGTTVNGGTLTLNGALAHANIAVGVPSGSGTFNGSGTIVWAASSELITVGSGGTFDASGGMQWDLSNLFQPAGSQTPLLNYSAAGATFTPPSALQNLLTQYSQVFYALSNTAGTVSATALPVTTWNVDSSGNWSAGGNWILSGSTGAPNGQGAIAAFLNKITAPRTVTVDTPITVGVMEFGSSNAYTIGGGNTLTLDNGSHNANIVVTQGSHAIAAPLALNVPLSVIMPSAGTMTISGNITENNVGMALNMSGSGTLLLNGTNSFTGPVTINSGRLLAGGGNALLNTTAVSVASGGTFGLNAAADNQTIGSLNCPAAGSVIAPNGGTLTVAANGTGNIFGLTGGGTVILTASASSVLQTLSNNSAFSGNLTIVNGAILTPSVSSAFGVSGGTTTFNHANWGAAGSGGASSTSQNFFITGGNCTFLTAGSVFSGNIAIDPSANLILNTGNGNNPALSGVISGGGTLTNIGGVSGAGTTTYSGSRANTFSGTTVVQQGGMLLQKPAGVNAIAGPVTIGVGNGTAHVILGANEQISDSTIVTFTNDFGFGSDLRLSGFQETIGGLAGLAGEGAVTNFGASASTLTIATAGNNDGGAYIHDGGTASLAVNVKGTGIQSLSGSNYYTGGTTVSESATLSINGELTHANIAVNGGTLNGYGTIAFNAGEKIVVGAAGTFDGTGGLTWDLSALTSPQATLLDYTSGGSFLAPSPLSSLLTFPSQSAYTITDVGNVVQVLTTNTWNVDSDGAWSNPGNWQSGNVPNGPGIPVNFGNAITAARNITLDIPVTVSSMLFSGSTQYTLSGDSVNNLTFNNGAANATIAVTAGSHLINTPVILGGNGALDVTVAPSSGTLTIAGAISEAAAGTGTVHLAAGSAGMLLLSGNNTFTGGVTVNAGTLRLSGSLATANIHLNSGTLNGGGTIGFLTGNEIIVGSTATFDASGGMLWNIAGLTGNPVNLLDFSASGATFISPSTLNSLLTLASSARYTLSQVGNVIEATLIPNNWNVDAGGDWSDSGNWLNNIVPNGVGAPATFGSVITSPRTVTLDVPVTVGAINFANTNQYTLLDTTGSNSITLNNGTSDAIIGVTAGSHLINAPVVLGGNGGVDISVTPSSGTLTVSGNISEATSGTGVLNVASASTGTVLLNGSNSFTGGLNIKGGKLVAVGGSALAGTVPVTVAGGATFALSAATDDLMIGALNTTSSTAVVSINGGTLNVAANGTGNVYGLTGAGTVILTASAAGVIETLGYNGAFTGSLTINNGTFVTSGSAATAFGAAGGTTKLNNTTWFGLPGGFTPITNNFHVTGGSTTFVDIGGSPILAGSLAIDPSATFIWSTGGGNNGVISGPISGSGTFLDIGGGTTGFEFSPLTLSGTSAITFTGATIVEQGTMLLQKSPGVTAILGALTIGDSGFSNPAHVLLGASEQISPTSVVTFATTASDFRLEGFNETLGGLSSTAGTASYGGVGNYGTNASTLTIDPVGSNTYRGQILDGSTSGSLALVINGAGTQVLSGTGTYTGGTTVESGQLIVTSVHALPDGGNLTVGNPGAFPAPIVTASDAGRSATAVAIPEPGALALLAVGFLLTATFWRRRRWQLATDTSPGYSQVLYGDSPK